MIIIELSVDTFNFFFPLALICFSLFYSHLVIIRLWTYMEHQFFFFLYSVLRSSSSLSLSLNLFLLFNALFLSLRSHFFSLAKKNHLRFVFTIVFSNPSTLSFVSCSCFKVCGFSYSSCSFSLISYLIIRSKS